MAPDSIRNAKATKVPAVAVALVFAIAGTSGVEAGVLWQLSPHAQDSRSDGFDAAFSAVSGFGRCSADGPYCDPPVFVPPGNESGMVPVHSVSVDLPVCPPSWLCAAWFVSGSRLAKLVSDRHVPQPVVAGVFRPPEF